MFKKLKSEDYQSLKCYFEPQCWNLCEYSLSSIIAWNHCIYDVYFRQEGDLLFISEIEIEKPGNKRLLLPLARPFRHPLPAELAGWAAKLDYRQYYYVPEDYISAAGEKELEKFFIIKEQPGYMDYIYNAKDLSELKGHKYSKKRNLLAQFSKQTAKQKQVSIEPLSTSNSSLCREMLEQWAHDPQAGEQLDLLNCERKAILNSLKDFDLLEMRGVMVIIDGIPVGFAFGSRLSRETFVLNFEKALGDIKGLYQFLDNEFAKSLPAHYTFISKESDLGKPGLIQAKESYYPCKKIKSYSLVMK